MSLEFCHLELQEVVEYVCHSTQNVDGVDAFILEREP